MNLKRSLIILFVVICIIINIAALALYARYRNVQESSEWVEHSNNVISQVQDFYSNVEKLVAIQRGYLLTGDQEFLEGYNEASRVLARKVRTLQSLTSDNSVQHESFQSISRDADSLIQTLDKKIALRRMGKQNFVDIKDDALEVKRLTDAVRKKRADFLAEERRLLLYRQHQEEKQENYYISTIFIASLASVGVLLIANMLILTLSAKNRHATRDLGETRERLELAMQGTSDGIFDWNLVTNDIYYSRRFRDMLGYTEEELPNRVGVLTDLVHPEDREMFRQRIESYLANETPEYRSEFRIMHRDGFWRWHLARAKALFDENNKAHRMVGAHTDITHEKAAEEYLLASNKELESFTYIASHDLRSPLVNLKGFANEIYDATNRIGLFIKKALPLVPYPNADDVKSAIESDIPQALSFIKTSVTKMEKLTTAILELSRVGRRQLKFQILPVRPIIDNCLRALQHQITQKNVTIDIGETPDVVADSIAMEQIFGNIIDNAIKYLDPHRPGHIAIAGERGLSDTVYHIADNGRGIREEDQAKVFELFKRVGRHDNIPGEGMGMSYVQATLRRHGGLIWLESEPDKRTVFYFSIPNQLNKEKENV